MRIKSLKPRNCEVHEVLAQIESRSRRKAQTSPEISTQIIFGAIAVEIQKQRFTHENHCAHCLQQEAA
jgi:hypothetical protein